MLDKAKKTYKIGFTATLSASIAAAVLLALSLFFDYNAKLGHFAADSILSQAAAIMYFISAASAIATAIFTSRGTEIRAEGITVSFPSRAVAILTAVFFLAFAVKQFLSGEFSSADASFIDKATVLSVITVILYFADHALRVASPQKQLLAVLTLIFAIFSAMKLYFDPALAINSPAKAYLLTVLSGYILFFTGESRLALLRTKSSAQILLSLTAVSFGSVAPAVLIYAFAKGAIGSFDLISSAAYTALWIFAVTRAVSLKSVICEAGATSDVSEADSTPTDE